MAKYLKDILKAAHNTIKGVRPSETSALYIGKDPGVDYKPKAGDEADFVAKHSVQKWDDPAGNPNFADKVDYSLSKEKNHGNTIAKAKATNEEVEQIDEIGDTKRGQKLINKVHKRASERLGKAVTDKDPKNAKKYQEVGQQAWDRMPSNKYEEVQIDEISKDLARSYIKKASTQVDDADEYDEKQSKKMDRREAGIRMASMKKNASKSVEVAATEEFSESKKAEDTKCNMSEAGTWCPMHEMASCSASKMIKELSTDTYHRAAHKAAKMAMSDVQGRSGPIFKKRAAQANKFRAKGMEQEKKEKAMKEEAIDEKHLTPAEMKKREEVAQAIHKKDPSMSMDKKMAIATSTAKKATKISHYRADRDKHMEEEVIDEKLTDDAKKVIRGALTGPAMKKTSGPARAMIQIAKMNPKNVKEDLAVPLLGGDHPPRGESEEAIEMVKAELKALANKAMHLVMQMPAGMHVEPWCQSKIAQAKSYVSDVHDYMMFGDHDKEEDEQMDTPLTLPNMSVDVNAGRNV